MTNHVNQKIHVFPFIKTSKHADILSFLKIYGIAVLLGLCSAVITVPMVPLLGITAYYLLFFPAVSLSSWYGNIKSSIVTTCIAAAGIGYLLLIHYRSIVLHPLTSYVIVSVLFFEGLLISFIIHKARQSIQLTEYIKRDKENKNIILELQKEYIKASEEIKARDEFLSIASHELKTPLTTMLLQIQTALHNIRNVSLANFSVEKLMNMLDSTEQQTKRLSKMINDLLNVSLITTGRLHLEPEEFDLITLVHNIVNQFSEKLKREGYVITLEAEKEITGIWDRLRIEQVLTNLLSNAMKYGNHKPISLKVLKHGSSAEIILSDEGIGIEADKIDRIFNRFERVVSSQDYKGLGIGLYITHQIVKAHGGTITVTSTVNKGTTFKIKLPIKHAEKHTSQDLSNGQYTTPPQITS